jgi:uroporphyrin-III C-methyltransferase
MRPRVMLVGAGPGSADLMTVRALRAVQGAQALLYDALVADEVVALAPRQCVKIRTGKRSGKASMKQGEINALMLKLALKGLKVVRLKGGDPSIFGRSGEEREFLEARGVEVEVVPGVTAASAAAAQFGFPLTHRGEARRLMLATARVEDGEVVGEGWAAAGDPETTLALYMGRDAIGAVSAKLVAAGRADSTPVVAVENAGLPGARVVAGTLTTIADMLAGIAPEGPVVIVVGDVAAQASTTDLASLPTGPLACAAGVWREPRRINHGQEG